MSEFWGFLAAYILVVSKLVIVTVLLVGGASVALSGSWFGIPAFILGTGLWSVFLSKDPLWPLGD